MRGWIYTAVAVVLGAVLFQPAMNAPAQADILPQNECQARDAAISHPYPISGFWIYQRRDVCEIRSTVESIHRQGGDTLLTFGPRLTPRAVSADGKILDSSGSPDSVYAGCVVNGPTCYADALSAVKAVDPSNTIVSTYAYSSLERYGSDLLRCGLDREVAETADRVYIRLLMPDTDPTLCADTNTHAFRLVLIAAAPADWLSTLFTEADAYGVSVYQGLPMPPTYPAPNNWRPDLTHLNVLHEITSRILTDYANRHSSHPSLRGVYQSFETPLKQTLHADIATLYTDQHTLVRQKLPAAQIVVSPYWDARRANSNGTTAGDIKDGFKSVARTDVDVIAPQDSRGTGKVGLFWPYESSQAVDPRLAVPGTGIVPGTTYGDAYSGSTTDFYRSAFEARQELTSESRDVALWANLEAFEPTQEGTAACSASGSLTDKARLDRAMMFARTHASKIISFMWDGYYTCQQNGPSLKEQIAVDFARPVAGQAFRWRSSSLPGKPAQDGIVIRGYQLTASTVTLTWYDSKWVAQSQSIVVDAAGWFDPRTGADSTELPDMMQSVWVPFAWTEMAPNFWVHITMTNAAGAKTAHRFSLSY